MAEKLNVIVQSLAFRRQETRAIFRQKHNPFGNLSKAPRRVGSSMFPLLPAPSRRKVPEGFLVSKFFCIYGKFRYRNKMKLVNSWFLLILYVMLFRLNCICAQHEHAAEFSLDRQLAVRLTQCSPTALSFDFLMSFIANGKNLKITTPLLEAHNGLLD